MRRPARELGATGARPWKASSDLQKGSGRAGEVGWGARQGAGGHWGSPMEGQL